MSESKMTKETFRAAIRRTTIYGDLMICKFNDVDEAGNEVTQMAVIAPMKLSRTQDYIKYGIYRGDQKQFVDEVISIDTFNEKYTLVDVFKGEVKKRK